MAAKRRSDIVQLQIGKNGLTDGFIENVKKLFENETIIKVSILKSACRDKKEAQLMADKLLEILGKYYAARLVGYVITINKFKHKVRD